MTERTRCSVDDCEAPFSAKGYCKLHYMRWKRHGDPHIVKSPRRGPGKRRICSIRGCDNGASARGWCGKHYQRWQHHGDPLATKNMWLPAAPLVDHLKGLLDRGATHREVAMRLGWSPTTPLSQLLLRTRIREVDADRYCAALGLHVELLWPSSEVAA